MFHYRQVGSSSEYQRILGNWGQRVFEPELQKTDRTLLTGKSRKVYYTKNSGLVSGFQNFAKLHAGILFFLNIEEVLTYLNDVTLQVIYRL